MRNELIISLLAAVLNNQSAIMEAIKDNAGTPKETAEFLGEQIGRTIGSVGLITSMMNGGDYDADDV